MGDRHFSHDFCWRFVLPQSEKGRCDGSQERIVAAEYDGRIKTCLGPFQDWVGTLAGEISFASADDASRRHQVKFQAVVYLANVNRHGIFKPPTYSTTPGSTR